MSRAVGRGQGQGVEPEEGGGAKGGERGGGASVMIAWPGPKPSEPESRGSQVPRASAVLPRGGREERQYSLPTPGPKEGLRWESKNC